MNARHAPRLHARWPWLVGLVVIGVFTWIWRGSTDDLPRESPAPPVSEQAPESPVPPAREPVGQSPVQSAREPVRQSPVPSAGERRAILVPPLAPLVPPLDSNTRPAAKFDATVQHTADPCTTLAEPIIPEGYEQVTAADITVAWNPTVETDHVPFRPLSIAHLVVGVLDEAAQLTGTDRRPQLTIIVDASPDDFRGRTQTPANVKGFYDGRAVRLPARVYPDLRMDLSTLRHETMHAQLHATVGCIPRWFHEGLATYFGGVPPVQEWFAMLRSGEPFEIATLHDPTVFDPIHPGATRMYAVAGAMIVYIIQRGGDQALRAAVRTARAVDHRGRRRVSPDQLWENLYPGVGSREVLDRLAEKIFGMTTGPELDMVFRGPICCTGRRNLGAFSCRATQPRGSKSIWFDETSVPATLCQTRW